MIFNDWTYRQKNKALVLFAFLLLLLAWYLAFGKTVSLIAAYNNLKGNLQQGEATTLDSRLLREKLVQQDSLRRQFTADSTSWTSGLLSQVGTLLSTQAVGVSFENKPVGLSLQTVERDVQLSGSFVQLQTALRRLEQTFYIKSIRASVEKGELRYTVRLVVLKQADQ